MYKKEGKAGREQNGTPNESFAFCSKEVIATFMKMREHSSSIARGLSTRIKVPSMIIQEFTLEKRYANSASLTITRRHIQEKKHCLPHLAPKSL